MAEKIGDDDEVGAAAHEGGGEGVPQDVGGGGLVEAGVAGDAGDDPGGGADGEAFAVRSRRFFILMPPVGRHRPGSSCRLPVPSLN